MVLYTGATSCQNRDGVPVITSIERYKQNGLCSQLTWSSTPVLSYYGPLLSSSETISGSKHENKHAYRVATSEMAPPIASHLLLPRAIIIINNHRGILSRLLNAVIIAVIIAVGVLSGAICC